jgi:hypothetical protein
MSSLIKFWIASTLVLFLLALWPALQMSKSDNGVGSTRIAEEAKLVDFFCLAKIPTGGRANIPNEWEKVLKADIKVRENAGEAAGDIGLPRERQEQITALKPGGGLSHSDDKGKTHYVLRSGQGRDWYLVLTKEGSGMLTGNSDNGGSPSPMALAIAFALVGGLLMTLLSKVAFGGAPAKS